MFHTQLFQYSTRAATWILIQKKKSFNNLLLAKLVVAALLRANWNRKTIGKHSWARFSRHFMIGIERERDDIRPTRSTAHIEQIHADESSASPSEKLIQQIASCRLTKSTLVLSRQTCPREESLLVYDYDCSFIWCTGLGSNQLDSLPSSTLLAAFCRIIPNELNFLMQLTSFSHLLSLSLAGILGASKGRSASSHHIRFFDLHQWFQIFIRI